MNMFLDVYLDFISPFCYLANTQLPSIAGRNGFTLRYHPIDIPAAKKAAGNYGPSNRDIPAKMKALGQDLQRWAARYGVPLTFPKGLEGSRWNIGLILAERTGCSEAFAREGYYRIWCKGIDPADTEQLGAAASAAGMNALEFLEFVTSPEGEAEFLNDCAIAHARGVFGAPIMMIGDEVFWGNDRLDFLDEHLRSIGCPRS